jgi:soluble lytic murein transglycosylase
LIYPVTARDTIVAESRKAGVEPALIAGLIRQESSFNPRATSPAGARGLMQVMPSVGQSIAPSAGISDWNPAMLYDPGVNIELGIRHLAPLLRGQPNVARSLAAYNAGGSRVARWSTRRGAEDPEIFTERIPFQETRDYVKSVLRNREFYQALYSW